MSFPTPFHRLDDETRMQMESWLGSTQPELDATAMSDHTAAPQFENSYPYYAYPYIAVPTSFSSSPQISIPQSLGSEIDSYAYLRDASLPLSLHQTQAWSGYFWHEARSEHPSTPTLSSSGRSATPDETRIEILETRSPELMVIDESLRLAPSSDPSASRTTSASEDTATPTTEIDALMSAIQAKRTNSTTSTMSSHPSATTTSGGEKPRKHSCPYPSCLKSFTQKTHLEIHLRSHSGEKPFLCREPSCGQRFSQLGNLRTHERRHTGERPFACEIEGCGKRFAQRGNLRGHRLGVHGLGTSSIAEQEGGSPANPTAPIACEAGSTGRGKSGRGRFECRLDECGANGEGKWFTQLGNLKSHQNKFHQSTLRELRERFAKVVHIESSGGNAVEAMGPQERELWEYFEGLYRNCNKGIKGRGKGRRVGVVTPSTPVVPATSAVQQDPTMTAQEIPTEQLEAWWANEQPQQQQRQPEQHYGWHQNESNTDMVMPFGPDVVDMTFED